jgi:CO/xanthine dehydrogenase Mo-binding subunit
MHEREFSRKSFIKGGGALVAGLSITGVAQATNNPGAPSATHTGAVPGPPDAAQIDSWLQINPDNTVTLYHGIAELGQGSPTALRMIAAEELGVSLDQVHAAQLDTNVSISAFAAGSGSTRGAMAGTNMRGAAAAAKAAMLKLASAQLGVPVGSLTVDKGVVSGGGKSVKYSDLMAGKLFNSTIAAQNAALTDPSQFKVIGTRVPRIDIPDLVSGKATFIQNVRVPGMLHGRVVRPRGQAAVNKGATLLSVDKNSVSHIPNVQVVVVGNFVGVVAPHEYDAIQAAAQLKVKWDDTPSLPGSGNLAAWLRNPANLQSEGIAASNGDVGTGLANAAKVVSASYFTAYQAHAPIGPNCAVADVGADSATILCMAQGPYSTRSSVAAALGWAATPGKVRVQVYPGSGTYGRGTYDDVSISAALLSKAVGKPVRVQFMRWDDNGWEQFGPAQVTDVRAGIDAAGKIVAYDYTSWQHGWTQVVESAAQIAGVVPLPATAAVGNADTTSSGSFYNIPNRRVTSKRVDGFKGFLKGTYLRAPAAPQSLFASEQTIDALAHAANMDPVAFRIQNIDATQTNGNARWIGVLGAVTKAANWQPKVSASSVGSGDVVKGRGVAIGGFAGAFPAVVADITVNRKTGKITVDHLYAAQDAGISVNPASIENQMVGCLVQGCSRAIMEEVKFNKVRTTSLDWVSYPAIRFKDSPKVTTVVVQRLDQPPAGSGEPTTAAVAAAIGNAFFDATGVRLTHMPMTPGLVRGALAAAGKA